MSYLTLNEGAAPSTPAGGKGSHYNQNTNDGEPHFINDKGVDMNLAPNRKYNFVRNSGFWFAQRQAPGTLATYSSVGGRAVAADGYSVSNENASVQYIRTDTAGAPETGLVGEYYGSFTKITSTGKLVVAQVIEGVDTNVLRGSRVRVQLWAKGLVAASATWRIGLVQLTSAGAIDVVPSGAGLFLTAFGSASTDPTLGANMSYIAPSVGITPDNGTVVGNAANVTVTSAAWQRFGAVFDVPTSAKNLIVMIWSDSQVVATNGIALSQVSLTDGGAIQDWAPVAYQQELARAQRYYAKSFNIDTLPAQSAGLTGALRGYVSVAGAVAAQPLGVRFPVPLRSGAPTFVFFNPSAANAFTRNTTAGTDATATAAANTGQQGTDVTFTGIAAWTVAQAVAVHYTADAEL